MGIFSNINPHMTNPAVDPSKTIILIPTYNERKNLPNLIQRIEDQLAADVLIIDDGSPDGTAQLVETLQSKHPQLKLLRRSEKNGIGNAYKAGFKWVLERDYEVILMMDADLSHDPAALPAFIQSIRTHDAVFGSRYLRGVRVYNWSFSRLLLSKFSNEFIRFILGVPSTDTTTAYKCFRRRVLEGIAAPRLGGKQNAFFIHLVFETYRHGYCAEEIPFLFTEREEGESKMRASVAWESLAMVFRLWPLRWLPRPKAVQAADAVVI